MSLGGLCPYIVGDCLFVCHWVVYVHTLLVTVVRVSMGGLCPYIVGNCLFVCRWVVYVHTLLVTVCPCVVGWFMSIHCW